MKKEQRIIGYRQTENRVAEDVNRQLRKYICKGMRQDYRRTSKKRMREKDDNQKNKIIAEKNKKNHKGSETKNRNQSHTLLFQQKKTHLTQKQNNITPYNM